MSGQQGDRLREVAFHEAGHACVSDHLLGGAAQVNLWRVTRKGVPWISGVCTHQQANSVENQRLISLAGACAEVLCGPLAQNTGDALFHPIVAAVSGGDHENAGFFTRADVDRCLQLVHAIWPSIVARAELEIRIFNRGAGVAASTVKTTLYA